MEYVELFVQNELGRKEPWCNQCLLESDLSAVFALQTFCETQDYAVQTNIESSYLYRIKHFREQQRFLSKILVSVVDADVYIDDTVQKAPTCGGQFYWLSPIIIQDCMRQQSSSP